MARVRSPNYPALSLPEALTRVKSIHDEEQHLAAPRDVIAKHLGYSGLNGAALTSISALSKYGLLEEANGDKLRVSPLAMKMLYPGSPSERAAAIKEAASKPPIFVEIANEWEGERPSEENLKSYLIRRNFAVDAIDRVIKSYRETMDLVTQESGVYPSNSANPAPSQKKATVTASTAVHQGRTTPPPPTLAGEPFRVSFSPGGIDVTARLTDIASADELIRSINALKTLLRPSSEIKKPDDAD